MNQLAIIEKLTPMEAYAPNSIDKILSSITEEVKAQELTVSTEAGRKEIASLAYKIARSKTFLDDLGKKLGEEAQATLNKINAERKKSRDYLDALKEQIRKPLTEWEEFEERRRSSLEKKISDKKELMNWVSSNWRTLSIEEMEQKLSDLENDPTDYQEFKDSELMIANLSIERIKECLKLRREHDEQQAELQRFREAEAQRLKKEAEEREARELEERKKRDDEEKALFLKREAEVKAEAEKRRIEREQQLIREKEEAVKIEKEVAARRAKEAAEAAEKEKARAVEAERKRIEAQKQAEIEAEKKREANKKHKTKINNEVLAALMIHGITEDQGKNIIAAIVKGEVPHAKIGY